MLSDVGFSDIYWPLLRRIKNDLSHTLKTSVLGTVTGYWLTLLLFQFILVLLLFQFGITVIFIKLQYL